MKNAQIRTLSPFSVPLTPPRDTPVAGRPLVNLSLAVNYAIGGLDVTGYHVANLALHLWWRWRSSASCGGRSVWRAMPRGSAAHADGLALAAALVWALHPLNTEVVNYVVPAHRVDDGALLSHDALLRHPRHGAPAALALALAAVAACAVGRRRRSRWSPRR